MFKHKPIKKIYDSRWTHTLQRPTPRHQQCQLDCDSDQEFYHPTNLLSQSCCCQPQGDSLDELMQQLQDSPLQELQNSPQQQQRPQSIEAKPTLEDICNAYTIDQLNELYMKMMGSGKEEVSIRVRFQASVSVKFFGEQNPVSEVYHAEQYSIQCGKQYSIQCGEQYSIQCGEQYNLQDGDEYSIQCGDQHSKTCGSNKQASDQQISK